MNSIIDELEQVLAVEVELAESLLEVLNRKRKGILDIDGDVLAECVLRESSLLPPLQSIEEERKRLAYRVVYDDRPDSVTSGMVPVRLEEIRDRLGRERSGTILQHGERLRHLVSEIVQANTLNRMLLEHSREFIKGSLSLITDGYTRQLVDYRI